jgi:ABC-2 type transport system permease protein
MSLSRTLLTAGSYLLYFGIFCGVALLVSARAKSSQVALVVLLALWFFNCFVAPRVATEVIGKLRPIPSALELASEIEHDLERGLDGHSSQGERVEALKAATLAKYGVNSLAELPVNFSGIQLEAADEYGYQVYDKHLSEVFGAWEWQNRAYQVASVAAPLLAVQSLSMGLSGTDFAQHRDFTDKAESYRRVIQKQMSDALTYGGKTGANVMVSDEAWQKVPAFDYQPPGLGWVLSQYRWSLLLLAVWCALAWLALPSWVARVKPE